MRLASLMLGALVVAPSSADPLYARNYSPVASLVGVPSLRSAEVLEQGVNRVEIVTAVANHFAISQQGAESVAFDGESTHLTLRWAMGLGAGWELETEIPRLRHSGGSLDNTIEGWHSFWGLPNGNRDDLPRDQLDFSYSGPAGQFSLSENVAAWGEPRIALVKEIWQSENAVLSARFGVKVGRGDARQLTGSGANDAFVALDYSADHLSDLPIRWHGQIGMLRAGDINIFGATQNDNVWFASGGFEWRRWQTLHLLAQVDSQSALVNSGLTQIGEQTLQLSTGLRWLPAPNWQLDMSFSEDIAVDTAPDFVMQMGLRYQVGINRE